MQSVAVLIGQVSELRQQVAAKMNTGQEGMSSSPGGSARFNLSPVGTPEQLDALTRALGEEDYRHQLVTYLCSLGGDTVVSFVDRVFGALFSENITSFVTFYGRQQGKRPFFGTPLYNLVLGTASSSISGLNAPTRQPQLPPLLQPCSNRHGVLYGSQHPRVPPPSVNAISIPPATTSAGTKATIAASTPTIEKTLPTACQSPPSSLPPPSPAIRTRSLPVPIAIAHSPHASARSTTCKSIT
ncbi:hypothetical protein SprV_0802470000 [Sparganum proliferum]